MTVQLEVHTNFDRQVVCATTSPKIHIQTYKHTIAPQAISISYANKYYESLEMDISIGVIYL